MCIAGAGTMPDTDGHRPLHLCGFLIAGPVVHSHAVWRNPGHETGFLGVDHYIHIARVLERGKFDFVFFADRLAIADRYGNSHETGIRYGDQDATRLDPIPILGAMAAVTKRLGLGATRSTTYGVPFHLAREFATLDHISGGRAAWNVVTSMNDGEAQNFGAVSHLEHDARYDRADEFMELAFKLWDSWEEGALRLDRSAGIYADPSKVHYVNFSGQWFRSRGPLNIPRSPQGRPVIIQAGSSGRGKSFATRWADVVFALQPTASRLKTFADEVRAALEEKARPRHACRILASVMPFVGSSRAEAEEKRQQHNALVNPAAGLSTLAAHANQDFSALPMDANVDELASSGSHGNIAALKSISAGRKLTIAEAGRVYGEGVMCPQIVGTAADVCEQLLSLADRTGVDGFVVSPAFLPDTFEEFVDGVVPKLQAAGRFRHDYAGAKLRDHLS
jgi:FMN-dependent oxidoreductase (nitrilotriacetate monooxygenase family)